MLPMLAVQGLWAPCGAWMPWHVTPSCTLASVQHQCCITTSAWATSLQGHVVLAVPECTQLERDNPVCSWQSHKGSGDSKELLKLCCSLGLQKENKCPGEAWLQGRQGQSSTVDGMVLVPGV